MSVHATNSPESGQVGWVYFARCYKTELIKIGFSANPTIRLINLRGSSASPIEVIGGIRGTRKTESELHDRFKATRHHGEWFARSPKLYVFMIRNLLLIPEFADPDGYRLGDEPMRLSEDSDGTQERFCRAILRGLIPVPGTPHPRGTGAGGILTRVDAERMLDELEAS